MQHVVSIYNPATLWGGLDRWLLNFKKWNYSEMLIFSSCRLFSWLNFSGLCHWTDLACDVSEVTDLLWLIASIRLHWLFYHQSLQNPGGDIPCKVSDPTSQCINFALLYSQELTDCFLDFRCKYWTRGSILLIHMWPRLHICNAL